MCGIATIYAYNPKISNPITPEETTQLGDALYRRGPDGSGTLLTHHNRLALIHRRLAIIDPRPIANQPLSLTTEGLHIVFNGEIYNYRKLRQTLQKEGYLFTTESDTEVLLHLYHRYGLNMFDHLRGMYAFILWDTSKEKLLLARDPFGIKPLYYSDTKVRFYAASQVKALLKLNDIDRQLSPAGQTGFFLWGHIPEPFTLYQNIKQLPAGHYMEITAQGNKKLTQFFNFNQQLQTTVDYRSISDNHAVEKLKSAIDDSIHHHAIADVPVSLFLSAGIDSAVLAARFSENNQNPGLTCITLGFQEFQKTHHDEVPLAKQITQNLNIKHINHFYTRESLLADLDHLLETMDQPTTDGINTYFISKIARQSGFKVALSGLGADELFFGYPDFKRLPALVNFFKRLPPMTSLTKRLKFIVGSNMQHLKRAKAIGLFEYARTYAGAYLLSRTLVPPWLLTNILPTEVVQDGLAELNTIPLLKKTYTGIDEPEQIISSLTLNWYMRNQLLRDSDWASMAHSVEVRVPYLDLELFKAAQTLSLKSINYKKILFETAYNQLPIEVLQRKKTGFRTPILAWIKSTLPLKYSGMLGWAEYIYTKSITGS